MSKTLLMATVAALAMAAPAQAEKGGKHAEQTAEQSQQAQPAQGRGRQRQAQAPAQQAPVQQARQFEQRARPERQQMQRQQIQRPQMQQREVRQQPRFEQRVRPERQVFQQQRFEQRARPERQMRQVEQRARPIARQADNRARAQDRIVQRQARQQQQRFERVAKMLKPAERQDFGQRQEQRTQSAMQRAQNGDRFANKQLRQQQHQAERLAQTQSRFDQRSARFDTRTNERAMFDTARRERWSPRPQVSVGERLSDAQRQSFAPQNQSLTRDWYGDYAAQRYSSLYASAPNSYYDYNYNDGYLYQLNRDNNLVTGLFPLLGGAFGAGQMLPYGYQNYNVPYGYQSLYYDTPDYNYRYGDGAIYRVDPNTQMIQAVVALLTGQNLGIGQQLPMGYDVYNVPYAYRDQYADTADNWYRYDNGMIYQVDPYSRMIESGYPVSYGNYAVGYPVPSYASYGYPNYAVPDGYQDLYYDAPGYNYQYSNGGIYQVDPTTQLVSALVALVSGQNLGIGQTMPMGYDAYNVPYAYRDQYYDTADISYRYDDGYIYGVDPQTRMIQTAYPVSYGGYSVGYPMPAYAGYAVPAAYDGLYYDAPGYDYRYANGGIYQVNPDSRMVQSVAALLTGQSFGVGQMLPSGYDAYNVPYAYRSQYYDTPDNWYRYADGNIYRVDPQTRVIQAVIDAIT